MQYHEGYNTHVEICSVYRPTRPIPFFYCFRERYNNAIIVRTTQACQTETGGNSLVVRASEFKSEYTGFESLAGGGQGKHKVFQPLRVNSCADLFVSDPLSCAWHTPKCVTAVGYCGCRN